MGKKKSSGKHYTSKGIVGVNKGLSASIRKDRTELDRHIAQMNAFRKGRNVVLTIENPNTNETNKKFIRVNAKDILGDWRKYRGWGG